MKDLSISRTRGFSLVELMVAVAIALIATVVIFQVFAVSEGVKRTSTSGGDAQQNGSLALFSIGRDVRMAGYGINNIALLGCTIRAYDETQTPPDLPNFTLTPLEITVGATARDPDSVSVMYSQSDLVAFSAQFLMDQGPADAEYKINQRFGFSPGNVVIAAEPGKDCTMAEVTDVPGTPGRTDELIHQSGTYQKNGVATTSRFNKPGGVGTGYTKQGRLINLGDLPIRHTFRVVNNQLVLDDLFGAVPTRVIADNIVQLKAQYGRDDGVDNGTVPGGVFAADDGIVDNYTSALPVPPTPKDWQRNLSMRIAVVARSVLREKPSVEGGPCDTTAAPPRWAGGDLDVSADPNWNCYRYKIFETALPLRNMLWTQP
jgi:type IV pilus assembly protein PilW